MINVIGISRSFGAVQALADVSFGIRPGVLTGFVGGNGAGKTTTMRIILGVLAAHAGRVEVDGAPITADYRAAIGYMPEERGLYPKMPVVDQLVYLAQIHGMRAGDARRRAHDLLDTLGLADRARDKLEELSLGNQQRAQIAAALVHDPVALVLDEPFSGLDPLAVDTTVGVLRDYAARGVPVLFSSHQLDVVERICDDLVIIAGGRIRASGSRAELLAAAARDEWDLVTAAASDWMRGNPGGVGLGGVEIIATDGRSTRFRAATATAASAALRRAAEHAEIEHFGRVAVTLHDVFKETIA